MPRGRGMIVLREAMAIARGVERQAARPRIIADRKVLGGKPVVRGTRVPVELVLAHLAENPDLDDLFAAYPRLTRADVKACLEYAQKAVAQAKPPPTKASA
jgi:uncharacterized protein (DUF433 family)